MQGDFYCVVGRSVEYGQVMLFEYANSHYHNVVDKVMRAANRDDIKGSIDEVLNQLNWSIVKLDFKTKG